MAKIFGRKSDVQNWDIIRHELIEEFESCDNLFNYVIEHSEKYLKIGEGNPRPQNGKEYFQRLENNLVGQRDMLDFLIRVIENINLHTSMGNVSHTEVLKKYKEKLEARQRADLEDEEEDRNFVGRKKYINDIVQIFKDDRNMFKGVSICGMGGLGKTTLANKICRKLKGDWIIIKVDLREVRTLREMLKEIFLQLTCKTLIREAEEEILEQIKGFLRKDNAIQHKTILMLDNIEDVIEGEGLHKFQSVFLNKLFDFLKEFGDECKVRLLLTSRVLLTCHPLVPDAVNRFWRKIKSHDRHYGLVMEKEILPFDNMEAMELFNKSIGEKQVDSTQVERIVKLCGYSPLAITILCSSMRHDLLTPESIIEDLEPNFWLRHISRTPNVASVLEKSFQPLNNCTKRNLIRLSVFHSAMFDIDAAAAVLETRSRRINKDAVKQNLLILKTRSFVEISDHQQTERFSLHPVVFLFLRNKAKTGQFHEELRIAKKSFVEHFRKVICDVAQQVDKDCVEGHRLLGYDKKHVLNFYEIIATDDLQKLLISKTRDSLNTIVESRRIYEIADLLLSDDTKWSLIQNFLITTKDSGENQLHHLFWRVREIALLLDLDRNQEAKRKIDSVEVSLSTRKGQSDNLTMAAVNGTFLYQKGRYFRKEYLSEEALCCLKLSAKDILKVTTDHKILLSKIYNVMGGSEYRRKNADYHLARSYHEQALRIIKGYTNKRCRNVEAPEYFQNIGTCFFREGEAFRKVKKEREANLKYEEAIRWFDVAVQLDIQMKLDNMECHAQFLQNRGEAYGAMEFWEKAEEDLIHSIILREKILAPPNRQITIGLFKLAKLLYRKGVHLYHQEEKDKARELMLYGKKLCETIAKLTIDGGLPVTDVFYQEVKELTFKLLHTLQDKHTCQLILNKYRKFEKGKFDKRIRRQQSIGKSHFTQNKRYGTTWREPTKQIEFDSSCDDDEDEDDYDSDQNTRNIGTGEDNLFSKMSEDEAAVNLTGVTYKGDIHYVDRVPIHPFHATLATEKEEEDANFDDQISLLIDSIDMMKMDSSANENDFTEEGNLHWENDEEGCTRNADTLTQERTESVPNSMEVDVCILSKSKPPHVNDDIPSGLACDGAKSNADILLVKCNVDLILEEKDINAEETDHSTNLQQTRKRTLNQTRAQPCSLPKQKDEVEIVLQGKRRQQHN